VTEWCNHSSGLHDIPKPRWQRKASDAVLDQHSNHLLTDHDTGKRPDVDQTTTEDDVIRGATSNHDKEVTFPPPPPQPVSAIAAAPKKEQAKELTPEEKAWPKRRRRSNAQDAHQVGLLAIVAVCCWRLAFASHQPALCSTLSCFVLDVSFGFRWILGTSHIACTPADGRDQRDFVNS